MKRAQTAWRALGLDQSVGLHQAVAAVVVADLVADRQIAVGDKEVLHRVLVTLTGGWAAGHSLLFAGGDIELHLGRADTSSLATRSDAVVFVFSPDDIARRLASGV